MTKQFFFRLYGVDRLANTARVLAAAIALYRQKNLQFCFQNFSTPPRQSFFCVFYLCCVEALDNTATGITCGLSLVQTKTYKPLIRNSSTPPRLFLSRTGRKRRGKDGFFRAGFVERLDKTHGYCLRLSPRLHKKIHSFSFRIFLPVLDGFSFSCGEIITDNNLMFVQLSFLPRRIFGFILSCKRWKFELVKEGRILYH